MNSREPAKPLDGRVTIGASVEEVETEEVVMVEEAEVVGSGAGSEEEEVVGTGASVEEEEVVGSAEEVEDGASVEEVGSAEEVEDGASVEEVEDGASELEEVEELELEAELELELGAAEELLEPI